MSLLSDCAETIGALGGEFSGRHVGISTHNRYEIYGAFFLTNFEIYELNPSVYGMVFYHAVV